MILAAPLVEGQPLPHLRSAVIPPAFAHGFSTRAGGVSAPPYGGFNLGFGWGEAKEKVRENRRRLLAAVGGRALYVVSQVHGNAVARVNGDEAPEDVVKIEADALMTDTPGVVVAAFAADCVPLVMADPRTGAVAAVHAGWRGVIAGVARAAAEALASHFGARPQDLRVAAGPAIGRCCFEVGPEVAAAFAAHFPGACGIVHERPGATPHVDLRAALRLELEAIGVSAAGIETGDECTRCDPEARFYSYRRDGRGGQHAGFICRQTG